MANARMAQQARRKNDKKTRAEKTYEAFEKNLDAEQSKMKRTGKLPFRRYKRKFS